MKMSGESDACCGAWCQEVADPPADVVDQL